ncbi:hypothetical protein FB451DRAFT_1215128 [Mycena latifolia]|nr:hypothetical protein FB451DRAFT_1215128 [Mycena latifolia]
MTHGAPFYAAIALGVLIAVAILATIIACIIRIRARRRHAAATTIGWDPVVLADGKPSTSTAPDYSLAGDRDVGEPKRADDDFVGAYQPQFEQHPNPYVYTENTYYAPHQVAPLADSAAYPLPPPPLALALPLSNNGPYPTARPLPAHLADRDPHRLSARGSVVSSHNKSFVSSYNQSRASSRSGSVRSHLHSASTFGALCVANRTSAGSAVSSRASTALGMNAHAPPHDHDHDFRAGAPHHEYGTAQSVAEFGTPREREARPRFMSLGNGRGLDVPWRRESFAARGGGAPGWAQIPAAHDEGQMREQGGAQGQGQTEGWTQTIRASVLGAFHAVTGGALSPAPSEPEDDGLTRAPSMSQSRARARRESGWARFAAQEMDDSDAPTIGAPEREHAAYEGHNHFQLAPPPAALQLSATGTGISSRSDADTVRTENSRAPLIPRPQPVSRASSVYSTGSVVPGYTYGAR